MLKYKLAIKINGGSTENDVVTGEVHGGVWKFSFAEGDSHEDELSMALIRCSIEHAL